ncbi:conserved hypothetical protein [Histoplasma capsulatum G186AR]|uniref:Something about silencing protein 4 domain-containing protein n=1 Tax=Ajellomyces capsulatus (strain G186AR / H82 / ATCC MYA-2454 / RMSCC 2432) TaxID=447093 RepID=C0NG53_AJECG|nr:uncharacterized protein HCBG_01869 [Histoplasma capsulatum G186AR]EEH10224.1 conserved hypothetical protein [Histoplasma capsulatum G186AR]
MVARSAPTLRFSSVQHQDLLPAASPDPRSKISPFAHDTTKTNPKPSTVTTRRNAIIQQQQQQQLLQGHQLRNKLKPLRQSKLPFSTPASSSASHRLGPGSGPPPPPRQRQPTKTIPAHERPFKKAKLDGRHHDQASITGPAKLPLRSRDLQGVLLTPDPTTTTNTRTTTISSAASRTRSATTAAAAAASAGGGGGGNATAPTTLGLAEVARSPVLTIPRTTRRSAHSHHRPPVVVSEDVEKPDGLAIADDHDDGNHNQRKNDGGNVSSLRRGAHASAFGADRRIGGGEIATRNDNLLKGGTPSSTTVVGRERRSLRSHDGGSRSKSELALYFQNYEQILSLEPVKPDTTVFLIDDLTQPITLNPPPTNASAAKLRGKQQHKRNLIDDEVVQSGMDNPLLELHDAQILDLRPSTNNSRKPPKDPLDDDVYFKAHRRIERQEKQLRNIEKERAQHEKVQLDRLLDELQGHDWLRVMGISGITETEKKLYEPKRAYFIKEVSALIEKFRLWKEEERRRKMEKDQSLAGEVDDGEDEGDDNEEDESEAEDHDDDEAQEVVDQSNPWGNGNRPQPNGDLNSPSPDFQTYGEPPDINDVDAWAAHQLHQEAISASSNTARHTNLRPEHVSIPPSPSSSSSSSFSSPSSSSSSPTSTSTSYPAPTGRDSDPAAATLSPATTHISAQAPTSPTPPAPPPPAQPEPQPFTSFYTKRHLRDAAVGKIRRGRSRTAFGQPLPEVAAREFQLPRDILTEEAIDACQRKKRRLRRARRA